MMDLIQDDLKLVNSFMISQIKSEVPLIPLLSKYLVQVSSKVILVIPNDKKILEIINVKTLM